MSRKYRNLGPETLEMVETAPIPLLKKIISYRDTESAPEIVVEWPLLEADDEWRFALLDLWNSARADDLRPLEDRCQRICGMARGKGPTSLDHVVAKRRSHEEREEYQAQPDPLCRSAWIFLQYPADFEDAEAFYAARQYRDFGKMYDAFEINADGDLQVESHTIDEAALASLLTARLELPSSVSIRTLDLPKTPNHPRSIMLIVRHAGPLSSVFNYKNNGMRGAIYFRPPSEATLIWTPADRVMEICGPTPRVRQQIGDTFAEVVLKADLSTKPLNWRRYDLSRFRTSLELPLPVWDDVDIEAARLIEVELRLGNWSRRLSLRVTIDDDIEAIVQRYLGGSQILKHSEGFSRLVVAIRYSKPGDRKARSMEISLADIRSNLPSKTDPDQRDLGYRLLQFWGVLDRLQVLDDTETKALLPALLQLHDLPQDEITGAQLRQMGIDPNRLLRAGLLDLRGRQNVVLIDEDDDFGEVEVGPSDEPDMAALTGIFGEDLGAIPLEEIRLFVIKRDWLEEFLLPVLKPLIGRISAEQIDPDLIYLGCWRTDGAEIPLFFARRLDQPKTLHRLDVLLRSRQDGGVGIVLTAGSTKFTHLGPNVVMPLGDVLHDGQIDDDAKSAMFQRFQVGRWLALGGSEVTLAKFGPQSAMLYIPGKVPVAVSGLKQSLVIERLVAAYRAGSLDVRTGDLVEGTGVKSPADAWPSKSRKSVSGVYFENSSQGKWRLKTDGMPSAD